MKIRRRDPRNDQPIGLGRTSTPPTDRRAKAKSRRVEPKVWTERKQRSRLDRKLERDIKRRPNAHTSFAGRIGSGSTDGGLQLEKVGGRTIVRGTAGGDDIRVRNGDDGGLIVESGAQRLPISKRQAKSLEIRALGGDDRVTIDRDVEFHITVRGGEGNDRLIGGAGRDKLFGDQGDDAIAGRGGHDRIDGGSGNDVLLGGAGDDKLIGGRGHDVVDGGADNDVLKGDAGHDELRGGSGNDVIDGGRGRDVGLGGSGRDKLVGGSGHDRLAGGAGRDHLRGDGGHDVLRGGDDRDVLEGRNGRDDIDGNGGRDVYHGGPGADVFRTDGEDRVNVVDRDHVVSDAGDPAADWTDDRDLVVTTAGAHSAVASIATQQPLLLAPAS